MTTPTKRPRGSRHYGIQMSGRFDGDAWIWAIYLLGLVKKYEAEGHVILWLNLTEAQQTNVAQIFRDVFGDAWRVSKRGEHLMLTRRGPVQRIDKSGGRRTISRVLFVTRVKGLVGWRQFHATVFNFWIDGRRVRFLPFHGPAGVQSGKRWNLSNLFHRMQVAASKRGFTQLGKSMDRFEQRNPDAIQLAVGDGNQDVNQPVWNEWFEERLGTSVWTLPGRGTHGGNRRIDAGYYRGATDAGAHVVEGDPPSGFDHCAFCYWIEW